MELTKEQIRLLLNFQKGLGLNASEADRNVCKAYGDGVFFGMYRKMMVFKVSRQKMRV
jgi:hypothetical protein